MSECGYAAMPSMRTTVAESMKECRDFGHELRSKAHLSYDGFPHLHSKVI